MEIICLHTHKQTFFSLYCDINEDCFIKKSKDIIITYGINNANQYYAIITEVLNLITSIILEYQEDIPPQLLELQLIKTLKKSKCLFKYYLESHTDKDILYFEILDYFDDTIKNIQQITHTITVASSEKNKIFKLFKILEGLLEEWNKIQTNIKTLLETLQY